MYSSSKTNTSSKFRYDLTDIRQLNRLFAFTKPYRKALLIGLIAVSFASFLGLTFPIIVRELFNTAFLEGEGVLENRTKIATDPLQQLNLIAFLLIGIFLVQAGFNYLRVFYLAKVGEGVVADLRKRLFKHLMGLSISFFENRKTGEITSRLTSDITTVQAIVSQSLAQFVNQLITLIGGVIFLFVLNFKLTLLMLAIIPAVILSGAYFGRRLRKISTEFQDLVASANATAEEAITGIRVVKSFTTEELEVACYSKEIEASYQMALHRARIRAIFIPSIIMAMFIGISIVLWVGGRLVLAGNLPAGDLIAFLLLTVFVAGSIGTFTGLYSQFQEALGASRRIFELLDEQSSMPDTKNPKKIDSLKGIVSFKNVSFRYGNRGKENVLENISLEAKAGEIIALVGPSGAGKSTLISLIPRFYDPVNGQVQLDSNDLRDIGLQELRSHIGIVPQETQLFSGTILENIGYGREGSSIQEIQKAAIAANAHEFIQDFPNKYHTLVGERGVKLSGGQRQRIAIARALLKNPKILILDEATSSLDSESEALVQQALEVLMKGRTTFVIAHRLSTIRNAKRIIVLNEGRIVQEGNHRELLTQGGLYKELYDKQFSNHE